MTKIKLFILFFTSCFSIISLASKLFSEVVRDERMGTGVHFQQGNTPNWRNYDLDRLMPLLADSGLTWLRNAIYWGDVESIKGKYSIPEASLRWINRANESGLKISITFNGGNRLYEDRFDPEAYARAAAYVATVLRGKIGAIQILNEPYQKSYAGYYKGVWNGMEKDGSISSWVYKYVALLNRTAKAVKAVNPEIKVIGLSGLAPVNFRQLEIGLVHEVDGVIDHPYSYRLVPELVPWAAQEPIVKRDGIATADERGSFTSQVAMYRAQSKRFDGPSEIWHTEWGWSTFQEAKAGGIYAGFTESAQAKYILRRFLLGIGSGVTHTFQYDFRDDGNDPHNAEHNFGLIRRDGTPKPSYYAVQRLAATLNNAKPQQTHEIQIFPAVHRPDIRPVSWDGSRLAAPGSIQCFQFVGKKGETKVFIWSAERADGDTQAQLADLEISPPISKEETANFYDIYKNITLSYKIENRGNVTSIPQVTIPDSPICLIIPSKRD